MWIFIYLTCWSVLWRCWVFASVELHCIVVWASQRWRTFLVVCGTRKCTAMRHCPAVWVFLWKSSKRMPTIFDDWLSTRSDGGHSNDQLALTAALWLCLNKYSWIRMLWKKKIFQGMRCVNIWKYFVGFWSVICLFKYIL